MAYLMPEDPATAKDLIGQLDRSIAVNKGLEAIHQGWEGVIPWTHSLFRRDRGPTTDRDRAYVETWFRGHGIPYLMGPSRDVYSDDIVKVSPKTMLGIDDNTRQINAMLTETFVCSEASSSECLDYALWFALIAMHMPDQLGYHVRVLLHHQFALVSTWEGESLEVVMPNDDVGRVVPHICRILLGQLPSTSNMSSKSSTGEVSGGTGARILA